MVTNEGTVDRAARVVVGVLLALLGLLVDMPTVLGVLLVIVGIVLVVTGAVGFCPIYKALGMNTCKVKR